VEALAAALLVPSRSGSKAVSVEAQVEQSMTRPLISCLTVALASAERFEFLRRSIASYQKQSYPDRELVVVVNGGDEESRRRIQHHVSALNDPSIHVVDIRGTLSLGALRNESVRCSNGSIICQWDDDDLYHPQRLQYQYDAMSSSDSDAVLLRDVMQLFADSRQIYCTNWHATELGAFPASLMCRKASGILYPEIGREASLGEDTAVGRQLLAGGHVHILEELPHLYVYVTHGYNTCSLEHHRMLSRELSISRGLLSRREAALREGLKDIDFGPGGIVVQGSNGAAFTLNGPAHGAA
jgi:glycosyltransferase involved in cell wall biosynthesis